jgi:hypothetical protein
MAEDGTSAFLLSFAKEKRFMSATQQFYEDRAAAARDDAAKAPLDNVRERFLRAAAAWEVMASRLARTETMRAETEAKKAAAREAEALLEV